MEIAWWISNSLPAPSPSSQERASQWERVWPQKSSGRLERNWKQGVLCMLCMLCMLCWYEVEPTVGICFESYFVQQFCTTFSSLVVLNRHGVIVVFSMKRQHFKCGDMRPCHCWPGFGAQSRCRVSLDHPIVVDLAVMPEVKRITAGYKHHCTGIYCICCI